MARLTLAVLFLSCFVVFSSGLRVIAPSPTPPSRCLNCAAAICLKPNCKGGTFTNQCYNCCPQCAAQFGEKCGGPIEKLIQCDKGLMCDAKKGQYGKCACESPSNCALIFCKYGVIKSIDENGCETCTCKACKDGESFFQDCNKCSCRNGFPICTLVACKSGVCYHKGKAFKDGEQRPDDDGCNTCTCSAKNDLAVGTWGCTEKACPPVCPVSNCLFIKCGHGLIKTIDENGCESCTCKPAPVCVFGNQKYDIGAKRYEQCNECTCDDRGNWACTEKACQTGVCYFNGNLVKDGEQFFDGCNTCTCSVPKGLKFGVFGCTRKFCGNCPRLFCKPKKCEHGYVKDKNGCNTCECYECPLIKCSKEAVEKCDGKFATNKRGCPTCDCLCKPSNCRLIKCANGVDKIIDKNGCESCICKPATPVTSCKFNGKKFPVGAVRYELCNSCTCTSNGVWRCTKRACQTGVCYYEGNVVKGRFFNGCNVCFCIPPYGSQQNGRIRCSRRRMKNCNKKCPKLFCTKLCPRGQYVKDKNGCNTCECKFCKCGKGNKLIKDGESFFDGCNDCFCKKGVVGCSKKLCPSQKKCRPLCCLKKCKEYVVNKWGCKTCRCKEDCKCRGKVIKNGENYFDGCNRCTCTNGAVSCTEKGCPSQIQNNCRPLCCLNKCKEYVVNKNGCKTCRCKEDCKCGKKVIKNGENYFDGCNRCSCSNGAVSCTKKGCPSQNNCRKLCCKTPCKEYHVNKRGCKICKCKKPCESNCDTLVCIGPSIGTFFDKDGCKQCFCKGIIIGGGQCPLFPGVGGPGCGLDPSIPCQPDECTSDADCTGNLKCCVSGGVQGSPRKCITPVPGPIGK